MHHSNGWRILLLLLFTEGLRAQVVSFESTNSTTLAVAPNYSEMSNSSSIGSSSTSPSSSSDLPLPETDANTEPPTVSSSSPRAKLVAHPFLLVVTLLTFSFTVCIMTACICLQRSSDRGHEEANLASMSVYKDAQEDLRKYISSIYEMKKPPPPPPTVSKVSYSRRSVLEETQVPILEPKSRISSRKQRSKVKSSKSGNV